MLSQPALDYASQLEEAELDQHFVLHLAGPFVHLMGQLNCPLVLMRNTPYSLGYLAKINSVDEWTQGKRVYKVIFEKAWTSREILDLLVSYFVFANRLCMGMEDNEQGTKTFVFCHVQEYHRRYASN